MWRMYVVLKGREQGFRLVFDTEEGARKVLGDRESPWVEVSDDHGVTLRVEAGEVAAVLLSHLEEEVAAEAEEVAIREAGKARAILRMNDDPDVRRARMAMSGPGLVPGGMVSGRFS